MDESCHMFVLHNCFAKGKISLCALTANQCTYACITTANSNNWHSRKCQARFGADCPIRPHTYHHQPPKILLVWLLLGCGCFVDFIEPSAFLNDSASCTACGYQYTYMPFSISCCILIHLSYIDMHFVNDSASYTANEYHHTYIAY